MALTVREAPFLLWRRGVADKSGAELRILAACGFHREAHAHSARKREPDLRLKEAEHAFNAAAHGRVSGLELVHGDQPNEMPRGYEFSRVLQGAPYRDQPAAVQRESAVQR